MRPLLLQTANKVTSDPTFGSGGGKFDGNDAVGTGVHGALGEVGAAFEAAEVEIFLGDGGGAEAQGGNAGGSKAGQ
jgi:hypothetical protein